MKNTSTKKIASIFNFDERPEFKIFLVQVEEELKKLNIEEIILFTWRYAVRALPVLGSKGNFKYLKEKNLQKDLQAILYSIDFTYAIDKVDTTIDTKVTLDAAKNALDATGTRYAAFAAIAIIDVKNATKESIDVRYSQYTTLANCVVKYAALATKYAGINHLTFQQLVLEELHQNMLSFEKGKFWLKLYGQIWKNFQKALKENECSYWANWYQNIFEKGLILDEKDEKEIKLRLDAPENIKEQGAAAVGRFMEQLLSQGTENLYEARIVIVGEPVAGKTTLFRKLIDANILVPDLNQKSTHGININQERKFKHNKGVTIKASIWDFGGQDTQNYLHQYFYAKDNLFVLVCDQRAEKTRFDYWFEMITRLCAESRIIVVRNLNERVTANLSLNLKEYEERFPGIRVSSVDVDFKVNDARWSLLIQTIEENLSVMERVNLEIPRTWKPIRETIQQLKEEEKRCHITLEEFQNICSKNGLPEEDYQNQCLDYLHWLGYALHYSDPSLINTIFIDPEWITTGLYEILREENYKPELKGRFSQNDIQSIWKEKDYKATDRNHLLNLLLKDRFEVCYKVEGSDNYLVPILISNEQKEPPKPESKPYTLRFKFPFMPFGFFSRLIVRLYNKIWDDYVWFTGVWLKDENKCMAKLEHFEKIIETGGEVFEISIYGEKKERKELLSEIRSEILHIRKQLFPNLIIEEQIPCFCEKCSKLKTPYFHSRNALEKMAAQNQFYSQCQESGKLIPTGQLLDSIIDTDELKRQYKEMGKEGIVINNHLENIGNPQIGVNVTATATNTVTITINNILGEVQNLKEDFEDEKKLILKGGIDEDDYEVALKDIGKAETAIKEIESAQKQNQALPDASKNRLKRFVDDLSDENSTLHKGLKLLRKGRDYGVNLAELYNKVAANTGMPLVPPLALEVIKKL
jgi:small GTP-binding protein